MNAAFRAGLAVLMLVGFYVLALVLLGASVALAIWIGSVTSAAIAAKLTIPLFLATVGAVGVGLWKALFSKPQPEAGLTVTPHDAPALWGMVAELAREAGTRMPDEIRLIPDINAAVSEHTRLLGLISGRRYLYVGFPLLQVLTLSQLRAVLAHELGHYSGRHARLGAVAYRGHVAVGETLGRIGEYNVVGWIFRQYAKLFLMVDSAVTRRQEFEADRASVRVAGASAAAGMLRELPVLEAAWGFYSRTYVKPGWEAGFAPNDLFGGFAALVAARKAELDELRKGEPEPDEPSRWDTHPPMNERIAQIVALPAAPVPYDARPSIGLLPDPQGAGLRLQQLLLDVGDRTVLPWPEFIQAMMLAGAQRSADRVFRTITRQTGVEQTGLGSVFDLIAAGRLGEIAEPLFPNATRREAGPLFADVLESLMELAAARSGVAGWRLSWTGPAELVDRGGQPVSFAETAKLAVTPGRLDEAYQRLVAAGIDIRAAGVVERTASATGARLLAGLANLKVNNVEYDLLVLSNGLVFIANPGPTDKGKRRLQATAASAPAAELAARGNFVPYEEIAAAQVTKEIPLRGSVTLHNGTFLELHEKWDGEELHKESRNVLLEVLKKVAD